MTARRLLAQAPLLAWTLLALVPFGLITLLGFRNNLDIYAHPLGFGGSFHPDNFREAWVGPIGSAGMSRFFRNTVVAGSVALVVNIAVGSLGAYFSTLLSPRHQRLYLRFFLLGTVIPFVLLLIPYYRTYNALGLISQPAALGLAYGAIGLPTTVLVLQAFFVDFPKELKEAAQLDGLGHFAVYFRVVLPLSRGALAAVSMLLLVWVWSETQLAIVVLQDADSQTVPVGLLGFRGQFVSDLGPLFAGLTIATLPIAAIYLAFSRSITKGIALGGVFR